MKKTFILATRHGSKDPKVVRGPNDSHKSHREFLKQFRGKHRHPEFSEVCVVKTVTRFRLDPDRSARRTEKPKSLLQRALDVFNQAGSAPAPAPETAPKPETDSQALKSKAKVSAKPKPTGAFAARVAAAKPAQPTPSQA